MNSFGEFAVNEVERDLKLYCLKHWGSWWATRFLMNKAAKDVYVKLRSCSMATVILIISKGDPDYQKHIDFHEDLMNEIRKDKGNKIWLKK